MAVGDDKGQCATLSVLKLDEVKVQQCVFLVVPANRVPQPGRTDEDFHNKEET